MVYNLYIGYKLWIDLENGTDRHSIYLAKQEFKAYSTDIPFDNNSLYRNRREWYEQ